MPITKSAKKALRVSRRRREINLVWIKKYKALLKKSRQAIEGKNKEAAKLVAEAVKALDKAAKKNIIHKNKASRLKSRLMLKLNKAFGKETKLPKVTIAQKQVAKPKTKKKPAGQKEKKTKKPVVKTTKITKPTKKSA